MQTAPAVFANMYIDTYTFERKLSYMSLDHLHSFLPDLCDGSWDVHYLLFLYLLQNVVNNNKCTGSAHTSTGTRGTKGERKLECQNTLTPICIPAMDYHGSLGGMVLSSCSSIKSQNRCSIIWYSMIWPGSEMVLYHLMRMP